MTQRILFLFSDTGVGHRSTTETTIEALLLVALILGGLSGCNLRSRSMHTPTMGVTQAYQTVAAKLTMAAGGRATGTVPTSVSPDLTYQPTPLPSPTAAPPEALPSSTSPPDQATQPIPCDKATAGNPFDITIPDDTLMQPEQVFTKIWRFENVGSCVWTPEYAIRFFYGDQMQASDTVTFNQYVPPNEIIEISVEMVAPSSPGTYQGNWKLQNASGQLFGIGPNGDAPFWVRIVVVQTSSATPTPTLTATSSATPSPSPTPTPSPTPIILVSGSVMLAPDSQLDMDTGNINPSEGSDLTYKIDANNYHLLIPQVPALLGVYGNNEPSLMACQSANMSSASIALDSLSINAYLCFQTSQGYSGWLQYGEIDDSSGSVELEYLTWASP